MQSPESPGSSRPVCRRRREAGRGLAARRSSSPSSSNIATPRPGSFSRSQSTSPPAGSAESLGGLDGALALEPLEVWRGAEPHAHHAREKSVVGIGNPSLVARASISTSDRRRRGSNRPVPWRAACRQSRRAPAARPCGSSTVRVPRRARPRRASRSRCRARTAARASASSHSTAPSKNESLRGSAASPQLFGRAIGQRAAAGHAEVEELHDAVAADDHVRRREVAVDDAGLAVAGLALVREVQRGRDARDIVSTARSGTCRRPWALACSMTERSSSPSMNSLATKYELPRRPASRICTTFACESNAPERADSRNVRTTSASPAFARGNRSSATAASRRPRRCAPGTSLPSHGRRAWRVAGRSAWPRKDHCMPGRAPGSALARVAPGCPERTPGSGAAAYTGAMRALAFRVSVIVGALLVFPFPAG